MEPGADRRDDHPEAARPDEPGGARGAGFGAVPVHRRARQRLLLQLLAAEGAGDRRLDGQSLRPANRAGAQVFARVVLPADTDPETKQPSFVLVPGTVYDNVDGWQRFELLDLRLAVERRRGCCGPRRSGRWPVEGAYIDQLVWSTCSPGRAPTEVFLDELSVGPVPPEVAAAQAGQGGRGRRPDRHRPPEARRRRVLARAARPRPAQEAGRGRAVSRLVLHRGRRPRGRRRQPPQRRVRRAHRRRDGRPEAVPRGRRPGHDADAEAREGRGGRSTRINCSSGAANFPLRESVLAWDLGEGLGRVGRLQSAQGPSANRCGRSSRGFDASRPASRS